MAHPVEGPQPHFAFAPTTATGNPMPGRERSSHMNQLSQRSVLSVFESTGEQQSLLGSQAAVYRRHPLTGLSIALLNRKRK